MSNAIATYFDGLRRRFPTSSARLIAETERSFETMAELMSSNRPTDSRCCFFEVMNRRYLAWEMDSQAEQFMIFAIETMTLIGIIKLSESTVAATEINISSSEYSAICDFLRYAYSQERPLASSYVMPNGKKRNLLLFGFCESLGQHLWKEISGLATAMQTGLFDQLDGFIIGPFDYFNIEEKLRAQGKQVWKIDKLGLLLPDQLIMLHSQIVTEEARWLVCDELDISFRESDQPTICFQIRRQHRSWNDNDRKLARVILTLAQSYPSMIFYIDGHCTSKGVAAVHCKQIEEEQNYMDQVVADVGALVDIRSTVGMDLTQKIEIFKNIDLFVGEFGSAGVLSSWYLRKPTLCFGPPEMYDMLVQQEESVPEGGAMLSVVPENAIQMRGINEAYNIDENALIEAIKNMMSFRQRAVA